jgi:hypothetical protein
LFLTFVQATFTDVQATFTDSILHVFSRCARKEMRRIATRRVIATVAGA